MLSVNFHAALRDIVGGRTLDLPLEPGQTVREMLAAAMERHPTLRPMFYTRDGAPSRTVMIFLNGRNVMLMDGLDTVIPAGVTVNVFQSLAGDGFTFTRR
jgi:molybdopterin synthase sulfur carrier subunit